MGISNLKGRLIKRLDLYIITKFLGTFFFAIALIISIIGSINWGLIGLFQFDLVAWIFGGQGSIISRIIYGIVGLAGLWCVTMLFRRGRPMIDGE